MAELTLVIGNKNYSSWSLRPWLALKQTGAAFQEIVIPLYGPQSKAQILAYSPSGKVPCLIDGGLSIWDSLSICEYVAEKFPAAQLWPRDASARAIARSVSAEMHSGFPNLRESYGMNLRRTPKALTVPPAVTFETRRVEEIWRHCRARYGGAGPFLFGHFTIADAMFAPVVTRFENYAVAVTPLSQRYMDALNALPAMAEWRKAASAETEVLPV